MKKFILILFLVIIFGPASLFAQGEESFPRDLPQEKLFIHYNTSLLFSGEYLYYQVYVLNSKTQTLDGLSKIAYVELIAENGSRVFEHKIRLKKGIGYADFFLPTSVPSGNYKLVGFTQWMKNGGEDNFFSGDVAVINPYRGDQSAISSNSRQKRVTEENSAKIDDSEAESKSQVNLEIEKTRYKKREKVNLGINFQEDEGSGNFSLSVRKKDAIPNPPKPSAESFSEENYPLELREALEFLPELRGELISGKVIPEEAVSIKNKMLALSIPGENFEFKVAGTTEDGNFWFNIAENYSGDLGFIEVIDDERENFHIQLDPLPTIDASLLEFHNFKINSSMKASILERSIQNQVENAYFEVKPDTVKPLENGGPFYTKDPEWFVLDEYTRFSTLKETFVEIVNMAYITRNANGEQVFKVRNLEGAQDFKLPTLLMVDGVMAQDHHTFYNFPARKIEKIGILRENYYLGPHIFQGMIIIKTMEGNYAESSNNEELFKTNLNKPQPNKTYFKAFYGENSSANTNRIPDYRHQLLWLPEMELNNKEEIFFFTSDISGKFEINLEGFTKDGKPVSVTKEIFVD